MKKIFKSAVSVVLCFIMVFGTVAVGGFNALGVTASAANSDWSVGSIIEYGTYPQSEVKDEALIARLNAADGEWVSYRYYTAATFSDNGTMAPADYMRYKDVSLNGGKYRAVTFDSYRPDYTNSPTDEYSKNYHANSGYQTGNVYWFKFEPLTWRVLDPDTGLVMCNTVIDSQPYHNYCLKKMVMITETLTAPTMPLITPTVQSEIG